MSDPLCYLRPLVELLRDGRLEAAERASMEQHLAGCVECQGTHRDLVRLADLLRAPAVTSPPPPPTPGPRAAATVLDHRRGRMRLLQAAALLEPSTERTTFVGLSAVAIPSRVGWAMPVGRIALAALVVLGVGHSRTPVPTGSPAPTEAAVSTESPAEAPAAAATATALDTPEPPAPVMPAPCEARPPVRSIAPTPVPTSHPAPEPVVPAGPAKAPEPPAPTFAAGVGSMEQGNYGEAIDRLNAFRRSHPDDLRSEDAAFLMIVALQRAGRHRDAVTAARAYLTQYPSGYRHKEAQSIVARGD